MEMLFIQIMISSVLYLMVYSILYRENILYRIAEATVIGVGVGYLIPFGINNILVLGIDRVLEGRYHYIIALVLGFGLILRVKREYAWLARWAMALLVGVGLGVATPPVLEAQILSQIRATFIPLNSINNVIIVVAVITCLMYFFFTDVKSISRPLKGASWIGRKLLMITFGASFGSMVLTRFSLVISRISMLSETPAWYPIPIFIVIIAAMIYNDYKQGNLKYQE